MPHPGDDSGLGTLLNRDSFRPGDRSTAHGRGVIGDGTGQFIGHVGMVGVEGQECQDRPVEILDVFGLLFVPASGIGLLAFCVPFGGPLGIEFGTDFVDGSCRCPNASGEDLPAFLLLHDPMIPDSFHSSC